MHIRPQHPPCKQQQQNSKLSNTLPWEHPIPVADKLWDLPGPVAAPPAAPLMERASIRHQPAGTRHTITRRPAATASHRSPGWRRYSGVGVGWSGGGVESSRGWGGGRRRPWPWLNYAGLVVFVGYIFFAKFSFLELGCKRITQKIAKLQQQRTKSIGIGTKADQHVSAAVCEAR